MNERDSVVVGIGGNVYNWLSYGIVGNSVCRTWESCSLAFPCAVNRVIHDSIACYAHFHNAPFVFQFLCASFRFLFFPVVCFPPCGKVILIAFHRFRVSSGGFLIHFLPGFLGGFGLIRPFLCQFCRRCRVGFGLLYQLFPCDFLPALVGFQTFRFLRR